MNEYREDWFSVGYYDAYLLQEWWTDADYLDDDYLEAYTDGYRAGLREREADW